MRGNPRKWPFTPEDDALFTGWDGKSDTVTRIHGELQRWWGREVPRWVVLQRAVRLGVSRKEGFPNNARPWSQEDLDWLSEHYGLLTDRVLCKHLGRTYASITLAAKRKLNINRKMNFYTAREVARELGISCAKTVVAWTKKGYLKGRISSVRCGSNRFWLFTYEDIEAALHRRPWLCVPERMSPGYFRTLVEEERARDPWYRGDEAAPLLGIADAYRVARYIRKGWLKGEWSATGAGSNRHWVIRRSWIDKMLARDPRPGFRRAQFIRTKRRRRLDAGVPAKVAVAWVLPCPVCGEVVTALADPNWFAPKVKRAFAKQCVNGTCSHNGIVALEGLVDVKIAEATEENDGLVRNA